MQDISRRRDGAFQGMTMVHDYGKMTPLQAAGCVRERRRDLKESRRLTDTPGAIVATARKLFELRGVRATSIASIAKEYAAYHRIEIELVHEMFCVVIFGLVGLVKMNPRIEDDVLMKVIEQTLRLDMVPIEAGEG